VFGRTFALGPAVDQPRHSLEALVVFQMVFDHVRPPAVFVAALGVRVDRPRQQQQQRQHRGGERERAAARRRGSDHRRPQKTGYRAAAFDDDDDDDDCAALVTERVTHTCVRSDEQTVRQRTWWWSARPKYHRKVARVFLLTATATNALENGARKKQRVSQTDGRDASDYERTRASPFVQLCETNHLRAVLQ